jgi:hypothetical protein
MTYEQFAAYWADNEPALRRYVAGLAEREDVVDDVLSYARTDLENRLDEIEPEPYCFYGAAYRYVSPFIPQVNYETYAVIRALKAEGFTYDDEPETVRNFLAEWHFEELDRERPYHPVLRHIDLVAVDWLAVTLAVLG